MAPKSKRNKKNDPTEPSQASTQISQPERSTPDWPSLASATPALDLELTPLLPDQILTVSGFWPTKLCAKYVDFLSALPLATTPGKPKRGDAVRVNDRFQIDDPGFAKRLWRDTALKELVEGASINGEVLDESKRRELWGGDVLGLNSNIRIYRYNKGQFFAQHYDDSNHVMLSAGPSSEPTPARTTWTLLLYLTSPVTGCEGGETVFYQDAPSKREPAPPPVVAELEVGMALLHRHGKDCLLHEGREVTAGEKWVIRSDLCVKQ